MIDYGKQRKSRQVARHRGIRPERGRTAVQQRTLALHGLHVPSGHREDLKGLLVRVS